MATDSTTYSTSSSTEDSSHSFSIHHGDSLGALLVSQPLTGENYNSWSQSMFMALSAKNKVGFIDGTTSKPTDLTDPLHSSWIRCNNMVISWILSTLSKEIAKCFICKLGQRDLGGIGRRDLMDLESSSCRNQFLL